MGAPKDPNSVIGRMRTWFEDPLNRVEMLTVEDIAARQDISYAQAKRAIYMLMDLGLVEGARVYRAKQRGGPA